MTRQHIRIRIDALTIEGSRLSPRALERAIGAALMARLAGVRLSHVPFAPDRLEATARPGPNEKGAGPAVARAIAEATHGVLKR